MVAREQAPRSSSSWNTVSLGAMAGPVQGPELAASRGDQRSVLQATRGRHRRPEAGEDRGNRPERVDHVEAVNPVTPHERLREPIVGVLVRVRQVAHVSRPPDPRHPTTAPERAANRPVSPSWSTCWWVISRSSRSASSCPASPHHPLELDQACREIWSAIYERQRTAFDQVGVDGAYRERCRNRQAINPGRYRYW